MSDARVLRSDRVALGLLAFGFVARCLVLLELWGAGVDVRSRVNIDAYYFDRAATRILAGDPLVRERYYYTGLHPDVPDAPRYNFSTLILGEERHDEAFGPHTYFDYPGYWYFVAACYALGGRGSWTPMAAQELLDLAACALAYLVARRLFDRGVARVALALAVLHGPLAFYAGFLLRDSLIAAATMLLVYLAVRLESARSWGGLGVAFAAAWILKGTFVLLLPFLLLRGPSPRRLAAFALGFALGVAPFAVRNVALGVPPLRMSTLVEASLVIYNRPGAATRGHRFDFAAARETSAKMTHVSSLEALRVALADHPSPLGLVRQSAERVGWHVAADDAWDNVRYSYLAPCLRSLALAPVRWKLLVPFVAIGAALALSRRRAVLLGPPALGVAMAAVGIALTRYRLHADHAHAILAAAGVVWLLREARARRPRALLAAAAVLVIAIAAHDPVPLPDAARIEAHVRGVFAPRTADYLVGNLAR